MSLVDALFDLEKQSWKASHTADADFYRQHFADHVLTVLPARGRPSGVFGKDTLVRGVAAFKPFVFYRLEEPQVVELSAVLTYRATAHVEGEESPYSVQIGSVYVSQEGVWRLAFHQQTTVDSPKPLDNSDLAG